MKRKFDCCEPTPVSASRKAEHPFAIAVIEAKAQKPLDLSTPCNVFDVHCWWPGSAGLRRIRD